MDSQSVVIFGGESLYLLDKKSMSSKQPVYNYITLF